MTAITSAVLRPPPDRFPPGTVVGAYRGNAWSGTDKTVAPTGAADVSATVAADGSLTFAGLTDQTTYHAWAAGSGPAVRFTTRHDNADDISSAVVGSSSSVANIAPRLLTEQFTEQLRAFLEWCKVNSATAWIGEVGWPSETVRPGQGDAWNAMGDEFYKLLDSYGAHATWFHASKSKIGDPNKAYGASAITVNGTLGGTMDTALSQAKTIEAHKAAPGVYRGVNMYDSLQNGANVRVNGAATTFFFGSAGALGVDYQYPTQADFAYLVSRGHRLFRIPVFLERLLTAPNSALIVSEINAIIACVNACGAAGGAAIVECHNFGQVGHTDGLVHQIANGDAIFPSTALADFWTKMSTALKANPNVLGYGVMNEPWAAASVGLYTGYVQAAINAIRANADTKVIAVPTIHYQLPGSPVNPYTDSASNLWHDSHFYADQVGGLYNYSVAELEAEVRSQVALADGLLSPVSTIASIVEETESRNLAGGTNTLVSGTMWLSYFTAQATRNRTKIYTKCRSVAGVGLTLARVALYRVNQDDSLTLLQASVSDTAMWTATFTGYTKTFAATKLVAGQRYAIGVLAIGTTMPALYGAAGGVDQDVVPRVTGAVAGQADIPASVAIGSIVGASAGRLYARVI